MEDLRELTVATPEEAVELANEINRMEAAVKLMKEELKTYVNQHGPIDTGQEVWNYYPSVSWSFDKDGLKELARNMALEGFDPWEFLSVSKTNLNKLGWEDGYLEQLGKKKVTRRFTSRKIKK